LRAGPCSSPTTSLPTPGKAGGDVIGLARTVIPSLSRHGLSTEYVDAEARLAAAGYSPDDGAGLDGICGAGKGA
ncbi:MAG TPA: hypothetical protein P5341_12065, partial [Hyphomonas sp.]|nr:hypothetical protein [Hyphomonas sp.]